MATIRDLRNKFPRDPTPLFKYIREISSADVGKEVLKVKPTLIPNRDNVDFSYYLEIRKVKSVYQQDNQCSYCKKFIRGIKHCGKCNTIQYCSKECQRSDFPSHKLICPQMRSKNTCGWGDLRWSNGGCFIVHNINLFTHVDEGLFMDPLFSRDWVVLDDLVC
jgi:hypothetical protein